MNIPIEQFEGAIRARVCSVCIDRSHDGTCALTNHPELIGAFQGFGMGLIAEKNSMRGQAMMSKIGSP